MVFPDWAGINSNGSILKLSVGSLLKTVPIKLTIDSLEVVEDFAIKI